MTVMSPKNKWELADMLRFALQMNSPVAIRYPRGKAYDGYEGCRERISYGKSEWIFEGKEIAILSVGHMFEEADIVFDTSLILSLIDTVVSLVVNVL